MSLFENIGFQVKSSRDLESLARLSVKIAQKFYKTPYGYYALYRDPSGAELWTQTDKNKRPVGINVHYQGVAMQNLILKKAFQRSNAKTLLDGSLLAIYQEQDTAFPLVFDVPNFLKSVPTSLPRLYACNVVGFTEWIKCFKDAFAFLDYQKNEEPGTPLLSAKSFLPVGMKGKPAGEEEPYALLSGYVRKIYPRKNKLTRKTFYHLVVETLGFKMDIVVSPKKVCRLSVGNTVYGVFYLSGRPLHPPF